MPDLREILQNKNVVVPGSYDVFKDIFRHFKGKQVGTIQGDDGPLLDRADEFYLTPNGSTGLLQGDILSNISSVWLQKDKKGELAAFRSEPSLAMVISNECDAENRGDDSSQSFIRLCPVLLQSDLLAGYDPKKKSDVQGKLERNFYTEFFWMPAPGKMSSPDSEPIIADLSHFFSISLSAPCSCGSGIKYKRCCLDSDREREMRKEMIREVLGEELTLDAFMTHFPEVAKGETRFIWAFGRKMEVDPPFELREFYCNNTECRCERVTLGVVDHRDPSHTIVSVSYAFDREGDPDPGPDIDPLNVVTAEGRKLFPLICELLETDVDYVERLKRHYWMIKSNPTNQKTARPSKKISMKEDLH